MSLRGPATATGAQDALHGLHKSSPIRGSFNVFHGLYPGERHDFAATERHPDGGGLKYTKLLESHLNGERELADAALVHLGRNAENIKESEGSVLKSA